MTSQEVFSVTPILQVRQLRFRENKELSQVNDSPRFKVTLGKGGSGIQFPPWQALRPCSTAPPVLTVPMSPISRGKEPAQQSGPFCLHEGALLAAGP